MDSGWFGIDFLVELGFILAVFLNKSSVAFANNRLDEKYELIVALNIACLLSH